MTKINEILIKKVDNDKIYFSLKIKIDDKNNLVFEDYTIGQICQDFTDHDDYEYNIIVKNENKDTLLLKLLEEKIHSVKEYQEYLDKIGIEYEIETWP